MVIALTDGGKLTNSTAIEQEVCLCYNVYPSNHNHVSVIIHSVCVRDLSVNIH